jgi:hypothetical protein
MFVWSVSDFVLIPEIIKHRVNERKIMWDEVEGTYYGVREHGLLQALEWHRKTTKIL